MDVAFTACECRRLVAGKLTIPAADASEDEKKPFVCRLK